MSKMLVSYEPCGCRAAALLDADDALDAALFRESERKLGMTIREEEHDSIAASRCAAHVNRVALASE